MPKIAYKRCTICRRPVRVPAGTAYVITITVCRKCLWEHRNKAVPSYDPCLHVLDAETETC